VVDGWEAVVEAQEKKSSALIGAIWQIYDDIALDFGIREGRTNNLFLTEIQAGLRMPCHCGGPYTINPALAFVRKIKLHLIVDSSAAGRIFGAQRCGWVPRI